MTSRRQLPESAWLSAPIVFRVPGDSWNLSPICFHLAATSMVIDRMSPKAFSSVKEWNVYRYCCVYRVLYNSRCMCTARYKCVYMYFSYLVVSHPLLSCLSLCRGNQTKTVHHSFELPSCAKGVSMSEVGRNN